MPLGDLVRRLLRTQPAQRADRTTARDQRLRFAFEQAPIGIAIVTVTGQWVLFNDACCSLLGYSREEMSRITLNDVTHPEDAKREIALIKRMLGGDAQRYRIEKRTIDKRGTYRTIQLSAAIARGGRRGESDVVVLVLDTPNARNESGHDAERLAALILDRLPLTAVIRTDPKGMVTGWNAGAERVFGYTRDEVIGKNRRSFYRDQDNWDDKPGTQCQLAGERGHHETDDWRVRKDGREIWVHTMLTAFAPDGNVRGYVEVVTEADDGSSRSTSIIDELRLALDRERHLRAAAERSVEELRMVAADRSRELKTLVDAVRQESARRAEAERRLREAELHLVRPTPVAVATLPAEPRSAAPLPPPPRPKKVEREDVPFVASDDPAWEGLGDRSPLDLLLEVTRNNRNGLLLVAAGDRHKAIYFEHGRIASVASDDPSMFLAERLVRQGVISEAQRQKVLEMAEVTDVAIGRVLIIFGAMTDDQVSRAMTEKIEDEIAEYLQWEQCRWVFLDKEPPRLKLIPLSVDPTRLRAVTAIIGPAPEEPAFDDTQPVPRRALSPAISLEETQPALIVPPAASGEAAKEKLEIAAKPVENAITPEAARRLVATINGTRYHRDGCSVVRRSRSDRRLDIIDAAQAEASGLTACRICLR